METAAISMILAVQERTQKTKTNFERSGEDSPWHQFNCNLHNILEYSKKN